MTSVSSWSSQSQTSRPVNGIQPQYSSSQYSSQSNYQPISQSSNQTTESALPIELTCAIVLHATDAAFTQLQNEAQSQDRTTNIQSASQDAALMQLHSLYGSVLEKAVTLVDRGFVTMLRARPSDRFTFSVHGSNNQSDSAYICSLHHCSCPAFTNSVALKTEHIYCKHQLAARLAYALNKIKVTEMSDAEFNTATLNDRLRPANQWEQREHRPFNSKFKSYGQR